MKTQSLKTPLNSSNMLNNPSHNPLNPFFVLKNLFSSAEIEQKCSKNEQSNVQVANPALAVKDRQITMVDIPRGSQELNKCTNYLVVQGNPIKIKQIYDGFKRKKSFESIIGYDPKHVKSDWYTHNLAYYGTEWDICPEFTNVFLDEDNRLIVSFGTAWSPPKEFVRNMCRLYQVAAYMEYRIKVLDLSGYVEYDQKGILFGNEQYSLIEGNAKMDENRFILRQVTPKKMAA